jgi:hypothetical protein
MPHSQYSPGLPVYLPRCPRFSTVTNDATPSETGIALLLLKHLLYLSSLAHPDASEVHVEDLAPVTGRNFGRWYSRTGDAGIVDSDLYTPKGLCSFANAFLYRLLIADIHFDRLNVDIRMPLLKLAHCRLQSLWIDISNC